jgi:hypothetical protein
MTQRKFAGWCAGAVLAALLGSASVPAEDKAKALPKGSEKAVAAVREAFPKAEIDEAAEPKGFGGSGGKGTPLFWSVRFHVGDKKQELSVTPEGTIIRLPAPVEPKDLPKAVADAVAKAEPKAAVRGAEKHELRATMKYVALEKPQVREYVIEAVKDDKRWRVTMNGEGGDAKATELKEPKKDEKKDKADKPADADKEIDVPEKAVKAVKAIKGVYPDAMVKEITTEVFDDGSGEIEILTYEVEFLSKGVKHEMVASPEGVIPHLWATVEARDLPKAVTEALEKAAPGAKVDRARRFEIRAGLRFAAVEKPKVFYTVRVEQDGKEKTLKLKPNGEAIKTFELPKKNDK